MAQKLPKMAQKLAPAKKIAEIYLQYLQLFASLLKKWGVYELEVPIQGLQYEVAELGVERVIPKVHGAADFCPRCLSIFKRCFSTNVHHS